MNLHRRDFISALHDVIRQPHCFFLLGAGASALRFPITRNIFRPILRKLLLARGGYFPSDEKDQDPIIEYCCQEIENHPDDYWDILGRPGNALNWTPRLAARIARTELPRAALHALVLRSLTPDPRVFRQPALAWLPEYDFFRLVPSPAHLMTTNIDGLIRRCVRYGHRIYELHGRPIGSGIYSEEFDELIREQVRHGYDFSLIPADRVVYREEHPELIESRLYEQIIRQFQHGDYFVVIGYSFPRDDRHTLNFFAELLRTYPKKVLIIDYDPAPIAATFHDAARFKTCDQICARWDILSRLICETVRRYGTWRSVDPDYFCRRYERLENEQPEMYLSRLPTFED